uniref:Protein kinase domain-containing protein n=1 Tax=Chaetoceros debilis TaxID=122233 RepID=A0A6S8VFZ9_9STRA
MALLRVSEEMMANKEVVLAAVTHNGKALKYAAEKLKADKEVVFVAAVTQDGEALKHAMEEMKADKEVVLESVKQNGGALRYATEEWKGDKEVVLAAVKQTGYALRYATKELNGDREVVLVAVKQIGGALRYATEELKGDRDVVLAAVTQDGMALLHASDVYFASGSIHDKIIDFLKNHENGKNVLHEWVDDFHMSKRLHSLVRYDRTIADVKNKGGKLAIDRAIPECKKAMESALFLFQRFDTSVTSQKLHQSRTAYVLKVTRDEDTNVTGNDEKATVETALKMMVDIEQVTAELNGRKDLDLNKESLIIGVQGLYIDSSVPDKYPDAYSKLKLAAGDVDVIIDCIDNINREVKVIIDCIDNINREVKGAILNHMDDRDHENMPIYEFVLVFNFADRTLHAALTHDRITGGNSPHLVKQIMKDMATGLLELHANGRIHGDLKPLNVMREGLRWKLTDLDIACAINCDYGTKNPSSGYCAPEVAKWIFGDVEKSSDETLKASVAHDLWSLGVVFYHLLTGQSLFHTDDNDDVVKKRHLLQWNSESLSGRNVFQELQDDYGKELLKKLLEPDPIKRCQNFKNGSSTKMEMVLKDAYFSDTTKVLDRIAKVDTKITEIRNLNINHSEEIKRAQEVLLRATFEANEVQTPTTFVVLNEELLPEPTEEEKKLLLDLVVAKDGSGINFEGELPDELNKWKKNIEQANEWASSLTSVVEDGTFSDDNSEKFFAAIKNKFNGLMVGNTMYFYLIDELTGKPVIGGGYPIEIKEPADVVPKLLPIIQYGMRAMSVYNGAAGVCQMFGFPVPKVPKSIRTNMKNSVDILRNESSVEMFGVVHEKVQDADGKNSKGVRGASLRELALFFAKEDKDGKYAGLRRIADDEGKAIWTAIEDDKKVKEFLNKRIKIRKEGIRTEYEDMLKKTQPIVDDVTELQSEVVDTNEKIIIEAPRGEGQERGEETNLTNNGESDGAKFNEDSLKETTQPVVDDTDNKVIKPLKSPQGRCPQEKDEKTNLTNGGSDGVKCKECCIIS